MTGEYLIRREAPVWDALRQLEATERKTLFVVDDDERMIGTLTDGDVRRWILKGGELAAAVAEVCNPQPTVARKPYELESLRATMVDLNISSIPVLDEQDRVSEVLHWDQLFAERTVQERLRPIDLPVVIMAGGYGTRMSPFTTVLPKPLVPISGRTVVEHIIEAFREHCVKTFYLSVNHKARLIESYFEDLEPPYDVRFIHETKPLGTAGSLSALAGHIEGDLIVTNCDVIIRTDLAAVTEHHARNDNDITIVASLRNFKIPYGVCEIENGGTLKSIQEKPEYNFLVNTGLYVVKGSVLDRIPEGVQFHFTHLIDAVKESGGRVGVFPISDKAWLDTGEWQEYRAAVAELSSDRRRNGR